MPQAGFIPPDGHKDGPKVDVEATGTKALSGLVAVAAGTDDELLTRAGGATALPNKGETTLPLAWKSGGADGEPVSFGSFQMSPCLPSGCMNSCFFTSLDWTFGGVYVIGLPSGSFWLAISRMTMRTIVRNRADASPYILRAKGR